MNRANVILITCHDLGQHLGCYGVGTVDTPNIDRLAAEGVLFKNSFCAAPQCSPSRAAMLTGRHPQTNGVLGLCHGGFKWDLHPGETHLARRFKDAGYHTSLVGTQHETNHPERMGFDELHLSSDPDLPTALALQFAERAAAWLSEPKHQEVPFYLQFGLIEPHRAANRANGWFTTHQKPRSEVTVPGYLVRDAGALEEFGLFEASVRTADDAVGRVMEALQHAGLAETTLVIFTSDHGIPFPRSKCSLYDPGLQVPLILRWSQGPWKPGTVEEAMVSNVDYVPTLCDLLGLPPANNAQGRSIAALLRGEAFERRHEIFAGMTYHDYYDPLRAIRTEQYKLIVSFCYNRALMDPSQQWRPKTITVTPPDPSTSRHPLVQLYDLRADPLEQHNLAENIEFTHVKNDLLARLHQWMVETGDPLLEGVPMPPIHNEALAALLNAAKLPSAKSSAIQSPRE